MSQSPIWNAVRIDAPTDRSVVLTGTALASFASLLLELALTRLFSVVLYYHFAFLAISVAMLGLGVGGVFAHLQRDWLSRWRLRTIGSVICALNAVAVLVALWVTLHTRVLLMLETKNLLRLTTIYVAAAVPFFFTGILFSVVFARESKQVTQIYGADLAGGAFACLAVVPMLNILGGPNAVICSAIAMVLAAAIWAETSLQRKVAFVASILLLALVGANHSQKLIDVVYAKGRFESSGGFSRWNAISRIEINNYRGEKYILIDSDAATVIASTAPHDYKPLSIPNMLRPQGSYAIIGPGGGIDVLGAVAAGSKDVTGIEINPIIANTIMRGSYADYSHHLYDLPQVHIHVNEGRSWIRSSKDRYDVIQMTLVDTWASTSAGAFALSENNLYTVEAFREYFDHLKPDGFVAVTRWEFTKPREALRVVSQAIEVLRRAGVEDMRKYFIVVATGEPSAGGTQVTVLVKKAPFTIEEERAVLAQVRSNPNLYPLYTPHVYGRLDEAVTCSQSALSDPARNCIDADLAHLAIDRRAAAETREPFEALISLPGQNATGGKESSPREEFIRAYPFDITPVTDNNPFFFFTFKTRSALNTLLAGPVQSSIDWKNNVGLVVLGLMLAISVVAVLGCLIGPLAFKRSEQKPPFMPLLYFVAIGLAYILVEIALIQRFVLFLGHPTYAMTVVVFLMLLSSGAGSAASKRWLDQTLKIRAVLGAIVGLVVVYVLFLHQILASLVGLPLVTKMMLSAAMLVPLGFLMGMPFPTALREIQSYGTAFGAVPGQSAGSLSASNLVEWAWALNAASSVLGSVLAIVVALHFGIDATLGCSAGAYLAAALLTRNWQKHVTQQAEIEEPELETSLV